MKKHILPMIAMSLSFISCGDNSAADSDSFLADRLKNVPKGECVEVSSTDGYTTIDVLSREIEKLGTKEFISSVRHVALETNANSILSTVLSVKCTDSLIYVSDLTRNVKCFDMSGKYIRNVFLTGAGPEEVVDAYDFDVDDDYVYVLDGAKKSIMKYDHQGRFAGKKDLAYRVSKLKVLKNGVYMFQMFSNSHLGYIDDSPLIVTDSLFTPKYKLEKDDRHRKNVRSACFDNRRNTSYYAPMSRDKIYKIQPDNSLKVAYRLDFGQYSFDDNVEIESMVDVVKMGKLSTYTSPLSGGDYILQYFYSGVKNQGLLMLNTKTDKHIFVRKFSYDKPGLVSFSPAVLYGYNDRSGEFYMQSQKINISKMDSKSLGVLRDFLTPESASVLLYEDKDKSFEHNPVITFFKINPSLDLETVK